MEPVTLKFFTLNCWTVPLNSKDITVRVEAIGKYLADCDHDVVFLQEVWSNKSFYTIKSLCEKTFPFSRCFYSGRVGTSGMCIFSRFPIVSTFFHPFMLNGYWYAAHHGDNHVCKGVAFARLRVNSLQVNCFMLHAEYDRSNDPYFAHRTSQSYELLQFSDLVAEESRYGVSIIAGDLNLEPSDLGMQVLLSGGYTDTWNEMHGDKLGSTCDIPDNIYTQASNYSMWPQGKRIDYILYKPGRVSCETTDCSIMRQKVPGLTIPLSDHEAVTATLNISKPGESGKKRNSAEEDKGKVMNVVRHVFKEALCKSEKSCNHWLFFVVAWIILGVLCLVFFPSAVNSLTSSIYSASLVIFFSHYFMVTRQEYVHLLEMVNSVECDIEMEKTGS